MKNDKETTYRPILHQTLTFLGVPLQVIFKSGNATRIPWQVNGNYNIWQLSVNILFGTDLASMESGLCCLLFYVNIKLEWSHNTDLPDNTTARNSTINEPEKSPTLKVVQGLCCSPSGGTLSLFMAFWRSPPSSSVVTVVSVSLIKRSMSLFV